MSPDNMGLESELLLNPGANQLMRFQKNGKMVWVVDDLNSGIEFRTLVLFNEGCRFLRVEGFSGRSDPKLESLVLPSKGNRESGFSELPDAGGSRAVPGPL